MTTQKHVLSFFFILLLAGLGSIQLSMAKEVIRIPVGVVLDLNSSVGAIAESCMTMALSDFYAKHAHYRTRLDLLTRNSADDIVTAASEAWYMMKKEKVQAIIGPQRSAEAKFVMELGRKAKVPIISFSATSPSLSPSRSPFFVRTAFDDSAQVKAIAAIIEAYSWLEVVLVYEDTDYGNGLIPYLVDAIQEVGARVPYRSVIPPSSNDAEIRRELRRLNSTSTRIFLVHMTASLGIKFFILAKKIGMMSEGYAWIVTEGLSTLLDPVSSEAMDSMEGVLGVRPHIPGTKYLKDFMIRWKKPNKMTADHNLFGLWAYDTVWALAMAVEKVGIENSSSMKQNVSTNLASLGTSAMGKTLIETVLSLKFRNLSGNFQLVKGQLEPSTFEIFNVIGNKERIIGYWIDQQKGLSRQLNYDQSEAEKSDVKRKLKQPIWPGDTTDQPATKKLTIGVPMKEGFNEFLKVENKKISGFAADVFFAALDKLPFPLPHDFFVFDGTYDDLLHGIKEGKYDAVVGDTTIVAYRSLYVDFTLPYSESGVSMVVLVENNERDNIWIFLKPLSLDLWLTTGAAFIFTGFVIWVLEHRINSEFRGPPQQQLGMIFWFSFSTLVFAHREKVVNNWSRLVLIIWVFVVLILTQSYTASLASMLTVQRLQPVLTDIREIQKNGYYVGYQNNTFIKGFLIKNLGFKESMLKAYDTIEEYNHALSNGTNNGGVAAIFDEIPYLKLFIAKNCSKYTMVGPTYKTDGFGFAFPRGSPLVSYMSRAILNVTQDKSKMDSIEEKYFGNQTICDDQSAKISSDGRSLHVYSFGGLFIIAGVVSMFSLLMYLYRFLCSQWPTLRTMIHSEISFRSKMVELAKHFDKKDLTSHPFTRRTSRIHAVDTPDDTTIGGVHDANDMQNNSAVENNIDVNENESNDGNILSGDTDSSIHVPNLSS
ncbi:hypothetical protein CerSpe_009430 [Prunus speciosa]